MDGAGHPEYGWREASPWYLWGPYLAERAWGSVREDYTAGGDAWTSFPHDHARSRAYRWNEDGMAGITDVFNRLSLSLALWTAWTRSSRSGCSGCRAPRAITART